MFVDCVRFHGIRQAAERDPRVTRVGRVMRAMGLDELPQLVQIWRGDMSLVGPRALAIGEVVTDRSADSCATRTFPGSGSGSPFVPASRESRPSTFRKLAAASQVSFDLLYIRRQSLWLDLRLIALSFWISIPAAGRLASGSSESPSGGGRASPNVR